MNLNFDYMKKNVLEKGFVELFEPNGLDLINLDQFKLLNTEERSRDNGLKDVDPELHKRLTLMAHVFSDKYINPIWPKARYNKYIVWEGIDNDNKGWHTDMFEGYDIFLLYYFDDTFTKSGGSIQFKWRENSKFLEAEIQPKKGTLLMVNNSRGFWHRAVSTTIKRRVASFDYNVGLEDD